MIEPEGSPFLSLERITLPLRCLHRTCKTYMVHVRRTIAKIFVLYVSLILGSTGCLPTPTTHPYTVTPTPGWEQGIRGMVSYGTGPVNEEGTPISLGHAGGVRVFILDTSTKQLIAETITSSTSDSFGMYEIQLLPGRYDVCVRTTRYICTQGVTITANKYMLLDIEIPES